LGLGVVDITLDLAGVALHGQVDVSLLTPGLAPRVADNPVSRSVIRVVPDSLDAVVNSARAAGQYTTVIGVPTFSSHADRWGSCLFQSNLERVSGGIGVAVGVSVFGGSRFDIALSAVHRVGVVSTGLLTAMVLNGSLVHVLWVASVAAVVVVGA